MTKVTFRRSQDLPSLKVRCDQPGCGASVAIYTTRQPSEDKQNVLVRLRTSRFHTKCENGHVVSLPDAQSCYIADGPLCNPF